MLINYYDIYTDKFWLFTLRKYSYIPNSGVARLFFFTKKFVNLHEMWTYTFIKSEKKISLHVFSTLHVYKK